MAILEGKKTAKDYFTKFEPFTLPFAYDFHGEIFESYARWNKHSNYVHIYFTTYLRLLTLLFYLWQLRHQL